MEEHLGIKIKLSMENKSEHLSWESYYCDDETKKNVIEWAGEDFKRFGYVSSTEKVYKGRALPGAEERADVLNLDSIKSSFGVDIYPGTVNIQLVEDLDLSKMAPFYCGYYKLWPCMLNGDEWTPEKSWIRGWLIKFEGENLPNSYVEFISATNVREHLNMQDFPSYIVKLIL